MIFGVGILSGLLLKGNSRGNNDCGGAPLTSGWFGPEIRITTTKLAGSQGIDGDVVNEPMTHLLCTLFLARCFDKSARGDSNSFSAN